MDTTAAPPSTPRKAKEIEKINLMIKMTIETLSYKWSLCLDPPKDKESPSKRSEEPRTIEQEIIFKVKALCFRKSIEPLLDKFNEQAQVLYSGWVHKPKAERGVIPERTRHSRVAVTEKERSSLLRCLLTILTEEYDATMTPKKRHLAAGDANVSIGTPSRQRFDDSPIHFPVSKPKSDSKRSRDQVIEEDATFKKPRLPHQASGSASTTQSLPQSGLSMQASIDGTRSAKTSFASETSSIFSNPHFNNSNRSLPEVFTQETVPSQPIPDDKDVVVDMQYRDQLETSFDEKTQSSEYEGGGSSFDAALLEVTDKNIIGVGQSDPAVDDELSQDMLEQAAIAGHDVTELGEEELKERLRGIFPELPQSLRNFPLCVAYEITRVFLNAEVSLNDFELTTPHHLADYDTLWRFLKGIPALQGKPFPERSNREAWGSAMKDFHRGNRSVYMGGALRYTFSKESSPLFRLHLSALRLDASHRSGRRFGYDRFLEIDMPNLTGRQVPRCLQMAGKRGPEVIVEWLVDKSHNFLDRVWKPFHLKPKERKERKTNSSQQSVDEAEPIHRVFFFAVDGKGFIEGRGLVDATKPYVKLTIDQLLNRIRPTRKNVKQPFLKLFSRTSLALSRNTPVFTLERHQIRDKPDIHWGEEVMTDGAGRISPALALEIKFKLELGYIPSGFQGRIGEAKGFWSVDWNDRSDKIWIEVYDSQRKWSRSSKPNGESEDLSHRTFEVLKCSGPLKSADLNLQFLPLLVDRARSPKLMKEAISNLLVEGLNREIETLQTVMDRPQAFRNWVREVNPNIKERLKAGAVTYRAGLPLVLEERLNVFLDAGFDPKQLYFMKEMTRSLFKSKCEDLKQRLNITVGQSTYVYMIPDFDGVLEPGEVYMDFSGFIDEVSGFSGAMLKDVDILMARSPAHYVSDIQKVRAVVKEKLMGLKDVIVFSTKENPSLATKLSGGDYDGDIAWVCWEPTLVNNFVNAEVPECPDLVTEGFIRKDKATYEELVAGHSTASSVFLKKSFVFNMEQSLLGICTNFKEKVCYTQGSVNTPESIFLSTLLSYLVDQAKQGYIFTEEDWTSIKQDVIKITPHQPLYKTDHLDAKAEHIIDHLMFVADKTIDTKLTEFHKHLPDPPQWDEELVAYYKWAREQAKTESQWATLLNDLDADLKVIKTGWTAAWGRGPNDELKPIFSPIVVGFHAKFQAIVPHKKTLLSQSLLPDCFPDPEVTSWALLKASAFFASYRPTYVPNIVWWLAGRQLIQLKCMSKGGMVAVAPNMYVALKPDASIVRAVQNEVDDFASWETTAAPANVEELEELQDVDG